jgi:hypothetical protein
MKYFNQFLTILKRKLHPVYSLAKADVAPFILDPDSLNLWNKDFFIDRIKEVIILE